MHQSVPIYEATATGTHLTTDPAILSMLCALRLQVIHYMDGTGINLNRSVCACIDCCM